LEVPKLLAKHGRSDLILEAMEKGWTKYDALNSLLEAKLQTPVESKSEFPIPSVIMTPSKEPITDRVIEASLCKQAMLSESSIAKHFTEKEMEMGMESNIGIRDAVMYYAKKNGYNGISLGDNAIKMAFSTVDLPKIFENVGNKSLMEGYQSVPEIASRLTRKGSVRDFKPTNRFRFSSFGSLEELPDSGNIPHGTFGEEYASVTLQTYGLQYGITRKTIINDDLSVLSDIPRRLGVKAKEKVEEIFFTKLLSLQTSGFFSSANNNLFTGAGSALSIEGLQQALTAFQTQTDPFGKPIVQTPAFLVIPPQLEYAAKEILTSREILPYATSGKKLPTTNVLYGTSLTTIISPYLNNAIFTGGSGTAWYLFGNPSSVDTLEITWLNGRTAPYIEQDTEEFDKLGIRYRVYMDVGIQEIDWRGISKSTGA
jgi:hypothetical protein